MATSVPVPEVRAAPVCDVQCTNDEVVAKLRPQVRQVGRLSRIFKALADETRLQIVHALSQAELCVCDVAALIEGSKATASYHLRLLHHMGMAEFRREGRLVYYRLSDPLIGQLVQQALSQSSVTDNGETIGGSLLR